MIVRGNMWFFAGNITGISGLSYVIEGITTHGLVCMKIYIKPFWMEWKMYLVCTWLQLDWTPSRSTRKINLPANWKGYDNSATTIGKLSTRKIQICLVQFCVIHFCPSIFNNFWNRSPSQLNQAESDSPRQMLQYGGLRSFWGASVRWQIIFFWFHLQALSYAGKWVLGFLYP